MDAFPLANTEPPNPKAVLRCDIITILISFYVSFHIYTLSLTNTESPKPKAVLRCVMITILISFYVPTYSETLY